MPQLDQNDLIDLHETLREVLTPHALEALAAAVLAGHHDEAMGILGAYAIPDRMSRDRASACVDALLVLTQAGRDGAGHLDGPGVREDLSMQPCQADVRELALSGYVNSAALVAVIHEGYSGAGALAAASLIVDSEAGGDVDLREVPPDGMSAGGTDVEAHYVARIGKDLVGGRFVEEAGTTSFEVAASGRRLPVARVAQAWKAVPRG